MDTQFKKGVLPLCVLALLKKDRYGYELVTAISETVHVSEGTIYPLLRRLKNEGLVKTYIKESKEGPPRKYYQLTTEGKKRVQTLAKDWELFVKGVGKLIR